MAKASDLLLEIQTAELPPKSLLKLGESLLLEITKGIKAQNLAYKDAQFFATPRRLAVWIKSLTAKQEDLMVDRKGPALKAAYDADGKPTPACIGFAKSCGVTPAELQTIKTAEGEWVAYTQSVPGKTANELMPEIVKKAADALPIPKRMRWGSGNVEFVRPVQSVILLYGKDVIDAEILGCKTGRQTRGHRFMSKGLVTISSPKNYASILEKKYVLANFGIRKRKIWEKAESLVAEKHWQLQFNDELLNEVTGLVEWPIAILGHFDESFLKVPPEALMSAMQDHQRYFPIVDKNKKLLPYFVAISNIESEDPKKVIEGNERVLRARLSDAAFFFATDKKIKLIDRLPKLQHIIFQAKLGTVYERSERIARLASHIAGLIGADLKEAAHAGLLSKTDLTTEMVGEFPELQGVMGYYYALNDGELESVALALNEQYQPRFSGDELPKTTLGCALALADRIDTLVGIFGINQIPTGDKDPFALRRAALGVLRILIEKELNLDIKQLIIFALEGYRSKFENPNTLNQVLTFILERLKPWYQEHGISADVLASVTALNLFQPYDIHRRINAVQNFKALTAAEALAAANKRVSNILAKYTENIVAKNIDEHLFDHDAEKELAHSIATKRTLVAQLSEQGKYKEMLEELASLRKPVDNFFDHVMVMTEDKAKRENRLLLLKELRNLFLQVADIALLQ